MESEMEEGKKLSFQRRVDCSAVIVSISVTITTWSRTDGATTCLVWLCLDT